MNASRLPLPVLHAAVVLLWAVLLGASWLVCGELAPASAPGARLTLPRPELPTAALAPAQGSAGLTQCPPAQLLSRAR